MKPAIWPAGLALLEFVLCAAAPAPDVRAAPQRIVAHGDSAAQAPAVAFDGVNYLVVWTDNREGVPKVYGARVSPDGTVLDLDGFGISAAQGSEPTVAFDGTNYLVVWSDEASIVAARVDPGGMVLDPDGITISTRPNVQFQPTLAFDGTNYL